MIVFRLDTTPGDLDSCMNLVQRTLPIALARPFVEQFVPDGTKVGTMLPCRYRVSQKRAHGSHDEQCTQGLATHLPLVLCTIGDGVLFSASQPAPAIS